MYYFIISKLHELLSAEGMPQPRCPPPNRDVSLWPSALDRFSLVPMVILVRATTRLWAPQALVLATQLRASSSFQLSRSALHTSAAARQQQQQGAGPAGGEGGKKRAVQELRPYATVVPAAERLVVIGDVHGDIGEEERERRYGVLEAPGWLSQASPNCAAATVFPPLLAAGATCLFTRSRIERLSVCV